MTTGERWTVDVESVAQYCGVSDNVITELSRQKKLPIATETTSASGRSTRRYYQDELPIIKEIVQGRTTRRRKRLTVTDQIGLIVDELWQVSIRNNDQDRVLANHQERLLKLEKIIKELGG